MVYDASLLPALQAEPEETYTPNLVQTELKGAAVNAREAYIQVVSCSVFQ